MRRRSPDMDDESGNQEDGNQAEHSLPQRLIDLTENEAESGAGQKSDPDAPVDRWAKGVSSGLLEIGQDNCDRQKGLEAFTKDNDESES